MINGLQFRTSIGPAARSFAGGQRVVRNPNGGTEGPIEPSLTKNVLEGVSNHAPSRGSATRSAVAMDTHEGRGPGVGLRFKVMPRTQSVSVVSVAGVFGAVDDGRVLVGVAEAFAPPYAPEWLLGALAAIGTTLAALLLLRFAWLCISWLGRALQWTGRAFVLSGKWVSEMHRALGKVASAAWARARRGLRNTLLRVARSL
jgi:hypothetical protein